MKRVVVTGFGAVTPIGNDPVSIVGALKEGRTAVVASPAFKVAGFGSQVWAPSDISGFPPIERDIDKYLGHGDTLRIGFHAARLAIASSGLSPEALNNRRAGTIIGTGGPSTLDQCEGWGDVAERHSTKRLNPFVVTPTMSSGSNAVVSTLLARVRGKSFAVSSACATSLIAIGEGAEKIALGKQDIMLVGGADDCHPSKACGFDSMRALVRKYNDDPTAASRPFDADHAGFVDAGGGAVLVLEALEHALARGANIRAEVVGYGNTCDGDDMVVPSGEGAKDCMKEALQGLDGTGVNVVDHVLAHATSTPTGDLPEARAIAAVFGSNMPWISAPKGNIGHTLGGAGAIAAVFGILSMEQHFVPKCVNLERVHPDIEALGAVSQFIARETMDVPIKSFMVNAFGFGGTNAAVVFRRYDG